MSCGQIALKELGIKVDNYYAAEIDKFAIQQTQYNFPNRIQLGSVTDIKAKDLPKIDLLIGGSPCQGFSFAGKQLNFNDPRSALFFEFVRLKNELKPKYFLLENVNMKKEYLRVISEYLGIFPVRINSNLVSAQNRDRWYWTNIKTIETGLFSELWTGIKQPNDKGILLKDILQSEDEIDDKYYIKKPKAGFEGMNINGKSNAQRTGEKNTQSKKHNYDIIKLDKELNEKPDQKKAGCLTAGGNSGGNHSDMDIICVAMRGRKPENSNDRTTGAPTEQRLEPKTDGKTNCLTTGKPEFHKYTEDYKLRRLTPTECARLQTIPDWYEWVVSDTQIYRMLGNGWTVDVIKHIFNQIRKDK